eukprot:6206501-Pleurochrysis_carterae.AAC.2
MVANKAVSASPAASASVAVEVAVSVRREDFESEQAEETKSGAAWEVAYAAAEASTLTKLRVQRTSLPLLLVRLWPASHATDPPLPCVHLVLRRSFVKTRLVVY